jgi:pSer/pThr/pTyr-binding forkhead associated (FHA) protein
MALKLLVVQGRPKGKHLHFPPGEYIFGRGAECHVRPKCDWVSRQHCLLRVTAQGGFLRDLSSRNGTLVNGVRILDEIELHENDTIEIGPLVFEVQYDEESAVVFDSPVTTSGSGISLDKQQDDSLASTQTASHPALHQLTHDD